MKPLKTHYWYWTWKTFLKPSRLRKRFTRMFLWSALTPLLLMGLVSLLLIMRIHRIDVATLERGIALQLRESITRSIDEVVGGLRLSVAYEDLAPIKFTEQNAILQGILERRTDLQSVSLLCTTPQFCEEGRETSKVVSATTETLPLLTSYAASPEFAAAKAGDSYFSFQRDGVPPTLLIALPVTNQTSAVVGVLRATFSLHTIQQIIEHAKLGDRGYAYVVDSEGTIIAHPHRERIGTSLQELPFVIAPLQDETGASSQASEQYIYTNLDGEKVSGTGIMVPSLQWGVIVEWPRAETERAITVIIWQIVLFALLAVIIIIIAAARTAFTMIGPIAYLTQGANIIGSGNFDYRIKIDTHDELNDLANNLHKMALHLKGLEEVHELKIRTQYLSESLKKEQEFSKLKDQFITTVSHQFNTPLTVINWTLEEIQKPDASLESIHEGLQRIAQSRKDMLNIANDLITLSEVGFSYRMEHMESLELTDLARDIVSGFSSSLAIKKMPVPIVTQEGNTQIRGNRFGATKIMENLIDNAITYSHDGGPLMITLRGTPDTVQFIVADQGIGIPQGDQTSMFQEFFRAKNAVEKKNVGTGLGLYLVKTILEKGFGGTISFISTEGKGSTFTVVFPREARQSNR